MAYLKRVSSVDPQKKKTGLNGKVKDMYLERLLQTEASIDTYSQFISREELVKVYAKNQLLSGAPLATVESLLPQSQVKALAASVEIDPSPANQRSYARNEPVTIKLAIKNVSKLLVRVTEINTMAYYTANLAEVRPDIQLDGFVAQQETIYEYTESPFARVEREFTFGRVVH